MLKAIERLLSRASKHAKSGLFRGIRLGLSCFSSGFGMDSKGCGRIVDDKIIFTSRRESNVSAAAMVFKLRRREFGPKTARF